MDLFLIAEIGINHNGSVDNALKLIDYARDAGFDAVKFQKRDINLVYTQDYLNSPRTSPWGSTQRAQKEALEFGLHEYDQIAAHCEDVGILWTASCWDINSQKFINDYRCKFHKIASPMNTHSEILRLVRDQEAKVFLSTGMSTKQDIDNALAVLGPNCDVELMHCNSSYPMEEKNANLSCIPALKACYGLPVGYSGHETTQSRVCITAVALGASSIERHITLDRASYGSDQASSLSVHCLRAFVSSIRQIPILFGQPDFGKILPEELDAYKRLKYTN